MFYQLAILDSSQSVLSALPMVKKVYFPREVLPLAQILANGVHFCLALVVFFAIAVFVWIRHPGQFPIQPTVIYLPLLIVIQMMLTMGLGFLVSALNTFYEDVKYLVNAILYMGFFLTPVMYFSENVFEALFHRGTLGQALYYLYHLNPIATLCTAYKKILLAPTPIPGARGQVEALPLDWGMLGITAAFSFFVLVFGYHTFNRLKWGFVERP
jgi:ABC-type polysaccharide/polyol phosphate export permease